MNELNTSKTFLMKDDTKLVDIVNYPDMFGTPEAIDVTTLSDTSRRYIEGIEESEQLEFTANYTVADFKKLQALKGTLVDSLGVWFGASSAGAPDGHDGKFSFSGYISVRLLAGEVNGVRQMAITVTPNSEITATFPSL